MAGRGIEFSNINRSSHREREGRERGGDRFRKRDSYKRRSRSRSHDKHKKKNKSSLLSYILTLTQAIEDAPPVLNPSANNANPVKQRHPKTPDPISYPTREFINNKINNDIINMQTAY